MTYKIHKIATCGKDFYLIMYKESYKPDLYLLKTSSLRRLPTNKCTESWLVLTPQLRQGLFFFFLENKFYLFIFSTVRHGDQVTHTCIHTFSSHCCIAMLVSRRSSQWYTAGSHCILYILVCICKRSILTVKSNH